MGGDARRPLFALTQGVAKHRVDHAFQGRHQFGARVHRLVDDRVFLFGALLQTLHGHQQQGANDRGRRRAQKGFEKQITDPAGAQGGPRQIAHRAAHRRRPVRMRCGLRFTGLGQIAPFKHGRNEFGRSRHGVAEAILWQAGGRAFVADAGRARR